ncbi:MAG TPA: nitroreductase family protein [Syntrophothermus lipocalidus]|uniref:nitroreductase family protein n=1 Tax=Syntrophothermus sp. TaxID=2736299 RepID=UPI00257DC724|nr:nitroreductase family protein [Syntrophothermus sp.]NSW82334.1 nitroreductase family protein [Syntrophothermus sp.]HOV43167.1 nitroreductase family protein [Syntrophothermus lipocalidus]
MEFYEVIHSRRAVRQYRPDPVPKEVLQRILDAANWAPSGMNRQQWYFVVASGEKKKALGASYAKIAERYTARWDDAERRKQFIEFAQTYGGAPVVIVALTDAAGDPATRKMNLESVSAAFENLLLAACAEGLGSCWMTGPLQDEASLRQILNIPDDKEIVAVTPIGYPAFQPPAPPRLDPELKEKVLWVE